MKRQYFGTDGIRGRANTHPMTAEFALKLALAAGSVQKTSALSGTRHGRVVIGKDTRLSGYMLEQAMTAGFLAMGFDVLLLGPLPTPAVSLLTRSLKADIGVVISASHNPFQDNGIKFFQANGSKLSDATEALIEQKMLEAPELAAPEQVGRATRVDDALGRYVEAVKASLPRDLRLDGLKIVVDCAHGAAYKAAPQVLWELGAEVVAIGITPNGVNINLECGATHPKALAKTVLAEKAHIGIALDGDADRLIVVDETGQVVDGDQILGLIAAHMHQTGTLKGNGVVSTILANLGLEQFLTQKGLKLHRTPVGDRYVSETMRSSGCNLGGEPSGHLVLSDYASTGDGLLAALQVLAVLKTNGAKTSNLARSFTPVPQITENIAYAAGTKPLETQAVQAIVEAEAQKIVAHGGRLVVRPSGTEALIRLMAECPKLEAAQQAITKIKAAIQGVTA